MYSIHLRSRRSLQLQSRFPSILYMNLKSTPGDISSPTDILHNDVQIEGTLSFRNTLEFRGKLKGKVISTGTLIVGKQGRIEGEINTDSLVILGSVEGNVNVSNKCLLKSTCSMNGDIKSSLISMEEGAEFSGKLSTDRSA
jgi:cytoskeletal protein CcmA (bactofilin family)